MMTNVHIFKHKTFYERNEITVTTYSIAFGNDVIEKDVVNLTLAHFNNSGKYLSTEYVKSYSVFFFQQLYAQLYNCISYSASLDLFMAGNVMVDVIEYVYSDVFKILEAKVFPLMSFEDSGMELVNLAKDERLKKVTINSIRVLECLLKEAWIYELNNLPLVINYDEYFNKYLESKLFYISRIKNDPRFSAFTGETADYIEIVTSDMNLKHPYNQLHSNILHLVAVFQANLNTNFTLSPRV